MSLIPATDIQKADQARKKIKKDTYAKILELISKKVTVAAQMGNTNIIFEIPQFVMGFPTFHRGSAGNYIERQLKNGGYKVRRLSDTAMIIDWKKERHEKETDEPRYSDDMGIPSFINLKKYAAKYK